MHSATMVDMIYSQRGNNLDHQLDVMCVICCLFYNEIR